MMRAFANGDDLHTMMAAKIVSKLLEEVTEGERQAGKSANFGLVYGMSPDGFRVYAENQYGVSFTEEEAYAAHQAFFDLWEGVREWHARVVATLHRTGQVVSPIGRVRRLPEVYSHNERIVSGAERAAINAPVQGFGSDLMQIAAASVVGTLPGVPRIEDVYLVGTVHDSIVAELPEDDWERQARRVLKRMTDVVPQVLKKMGCTLDVPLGADVKVGSRWGLADVGKL